MLPPKLEYLFVADFADGSRYFQTPADRSVFHPLSKSAWWDVDQRIAEVVKFTLVDIHNQHEHSVHLDDGHFISDGTHIPNTKAIDHGELTNYRVIYFRRTQQQIVLGPDGHVKRPFIIGYFIGWQANDVKEKCHKMMIEVPPLGMGQIKNYDPNKPTTLVRQ